MSAEAIGWVIKHSPYKGPGFACHLIVADAVNAHYGYEFWMTKENLAIAARCGRSTAEDWLRTAVNQGFMEVVEPSSGRRPTRYRFLMPTPQESGGSIAPQPPRRPAPTPQLLGPTPQETETTPLTNPIEPNESNPTIAATTSRGLAVVDSTPARRERPRDLVWEAMLHACGVDQDAIPKSARGAYNKACAELKEVGATPADIAARAQVHRMLWDVPLTPMSLVRHWAECGQQAVTRRRAQQVQNDPIVDQVQRMRELEGRG